MLATGSLAAANVAISVGYVLLGGYVWRRKDAIGSGSLSAFAVLWGLGFALTSAEVFIVASYGVTSGAQLAQLTVPSNVRLLLFVIAPATELFVVTAIYGWLWFVLNYTTRLNGRERIAIGGLMGLFILVTALNSTVGTLTTFDYLPLSPGLVSGFHLFANIVEILGTGIAIGTGIAQLFRTSQRYTLFDLGAVPALSAAVLALYLVRYLYRLGIVPSFHSIELLRLGGHVIGLVGLWLAVSHYRVFDQLPASQTVGRATALDNLETAIVVVNRRGTVVDVNPAAESLFDVSAASVLGEPFARLLPDAVDEEAILSPGQTTVDFPDRDLITRTETTVTTNERGREIGRTVVFNDVTDERRRQQRIEVLNRVLRHNLRNDVNVANGYLAEIARAGGDPDDYTSRINDKLDSLVTLGNKAREVENLLAVSPTTTTPTPLSAIVENAVADSTPDGAADRVSTTVPDDVDVYVDRALLQPVLHELLENSLDYTEGPVSVSFDPETDRLVVSDTGAGIPEYETDVLESGRETELEHGSGLGLWLVKWGVDRMGAQIEFETGGEGTDAIISLPPSLLEGAGRAS